MFGPEALAPLGPAVLTEGVKFLYGLATDLLKEWRARRRGDAKSDTAATPPPTAFEDTGAVPSIDDAALERLEQDLRALRAALTDYVDEIEPIEAGNPALLETVDALRVSLEAVTRCRMTFKGENRDPEAPTIRGEVDVDTVAGYAAGVRARSLRGGAVHGSVRATLAERDSVIVGVDLGKDEG